ncbi:MAG: 30S ribosomal protein S4e [Nitrososphaeraceae archaeon]|jgi:small subunit ribosomal protein S4e
MAKIGGDTRVKRQMAPTFWNIRRKKGRFVLRVKPGGHSKRRAYPLGIILRDVLKIANTMHEAERIVNGGKIKVDGIIRRDVNFGVGLMDIVELASIGQAYRFVPKDSRLLVPVSVNDDEKFKKLLKITSKVAIKGSKVQYGFHDGRTVISDQKMRVGDTCVVQLPESKINEHIEFERGSVVLVTSGVNAGGVGKVEDIRDGVFSLPKRALVSFAERSVELPVEIIMTVGSERPLIKVN